VAGFWRSNRGIGTVLAVLFALLLVHLLTTDWVYVRLRDGFFLGGFTLAGTVTMLGLALVLLIDRHRDDVPEEMATLRAADWAKALALLAGAWLMFETAERLGTLVAGPLFLFVLMLLLGVRPWTHAALGAAVMGGVVYAVFRLLGVAMPQGALGF
jgi:hypothetical protein